MGSSPSKRKLSHFSIKDALPLRFNNNNNSHVSNSNATVKPADRKEEHQRVLIAQPQEESLLSKSQGKRLN